MSLLELKLIIFLISLVPTFIYLLSWVKFQKYQFLERDYDIVAKHQEYSRNWHFYKGLNQIAFFIPMIVLFGLPLAIIDSIIYWICFDGWLNISVLKRKFFYVGNSAKIDKILQYSSKLGMQPDLFAAIIKISLLFILIGKYLDIVS